jgi:sugar-specific transcriptional regulator TrmB
MRNHELVLGLQALGLTTYEARAYLMLLIRGTLSASELAYHAELPRTKIYSILTKLHKKHLVTIVRERPLVCGAVPPSDAFTEILTAQEGKITAMRNLIGELQKESEERRRSNGAEERKYCVIAPDALLTTINELVISASDEIDCCIDSWGLRILSDCKPAMSKALSRKVRVRIMVRDDYLGKEILSTVPDAAAVRIGDLGTSMFLIDKSALVIVDSSQGRAAVFHSDITMNNMHGKLFETAWRRAQDISMLLTTDE